MFKFDLFSQKEDINSISLSTGYGVTNVSFYANGVNLGVNYCRELNRYFQWESSLGMANLRYLNPIITDKEFLRFTKFQDIPFDTLRKSIYLNKDGFWSQNPSITKKSYVFLSTGIGIDLIRSNRFDLVINSDAVLAYQSMDEFTEGSTIDINDKETNANNQEVQIYIPRMRRSIGYGFKVGLDFQYIYKEKYILGLSASTIELIDLNTNLIRYNIFIGTKF